MATPSSDLPLLQPQTELCPGPAEPVGRAADLLLRILAKLTVYQSLPDSSNLVLTVREDVPMVDACCLFLPNENSDSFSTYMCVEVLGSEDGEVSPERLGEIAGEIRDHDPLLSAAIEQGSSETSLNQYLTVADVFFFITHIPSGATTVGDWLELKRAVAVEKTSSDLAWVRFCRESCLVGRASVSLCPGLSGSLGLCSGSAMNLSLLKSSGSSGNFSDLSTNSTSPRSVADPAQFGFARSGGSTLAAVTALLDRPWQHSLPLTVSSEKGVTGIFGYVNLAQLMASVAMNCCDKMLEPFFSVQVSLAEKFGLVCQRNLDHVPVLHRSDASVWDAVEVLRACPIALLLSHTDETFTGVVTQHDLIQILANRMDVLADYSDGSSEGMLDLHSARLSDELGRIDPAANTAVAVLAEGDFPCSFATLLQKILLHPSGFAIVVGRDHTPAALISVRDVWNHAMARH